MSASSELPRGINAISGNVIGGGTATITLPAMVGVAWKIPANAITFEIYNFAGGQFGCNLAITYGTPTITLNLQVAANSAAAGTNETASVSGPMGDLIFPMDTAVTITVTSPSTATVGEILNAYVEPV